MTVSDRAAPQPNQFGWLVNDFVERVPGHRAWSVSRKARHVVSRRAR